MRLIRAGREFKAPCPFHNEKTPSFYVNDQKGFFHCFGCGAHGDIIGFAMRHDNLAFPEAVEQLAAEAGLQVPQSTPEDRQRFERQKSLHDLVEATCRWFELQLFAPSGRAALEYLHSARAWTRKPSSASGWAMPRPTATRSASIWRGRASRSPT